MTKFNSFTDLANSFKLMKISTELEDIKDNSIFAESIKRALKSGYKLKDVVQMVKDQAKDNRPLVAGIIGDDLLRDIENVKL